VFFGCGAYTAMGAYHYFHLPPKVGIPLGIAFAVGIAALIGVPTLRLPGHYFSMATIAVAELALHSTSLYFGLFGGTEKEI
jgi:branched-chain amino acid transport system permease protein